MMTMTRMIMMARYLTYRLDDPSILERVNDILPDTGELTLKLLTPDYAS